MYNCYREKLKSGFYQFAKETDVRHVEFHEFLY